MIDERTQALVNAAEQFVAVAADTPNYIGKLTIEYFKDIFEDALKAFKNDEKEQS